MLTPTDGLEITQDTVLAPGDYYLPAGIKLAGDSLTLDGNGACLIGAGRAGRGLTVEGHNQITIKNLTIIGYEFGIYAHACQALTIENCRVCATAEMPANTLFLDVWKPVMKSYGGGILLWEVGDSQIVDNDLQHQMNGLHLYHCRRLQVLRNNASYCSGWGIHLHDTSDSLFEDNYADYCCRYEPRGERYGHMGADAAGFLIVHNSCRNVFRGNYARLGGDGFFLGGMTPNFDPVGCDDNLFEANDGSYSPNIAFEATFSRGNIYRNNFANGCNYGFWLGFSSTNVLENNQINGNRQAGIATENGFGFQVRNNVFSRNQHGILLWSKRVPVFERGAPDNTTSYDWLIEANTFKANQIGVRIAADQDHGIRPLPPSGEWGLPAPAPRQHTIQNNQFSQNWQDFDLVGAEDTHLSNNQHQEK